MSDSIVDKLAIPANALDALVRAAPDDVVRDIVNDNYRRAAPTPPAPKSIADSLIEKFGPKAD
jgi:hypothetical protein